MNKYLLPLASLALMGCFGGEKDCEDTDGSCDTDPVEECTDTDGCDTAVEELPETEIDLVTYAYDAAEWTYTVDVLGWAESAHMYITQDVPNPWEEEHDLVQGEYDPDGYWDTWEITLPVTTNWQDQESGVNTLFAGDASMEATMAWRIEVYDAGAVADCVVWGSDISLVDTGDCREITF
jgi:hypothetical protein